MASDILRCSITYNEGGLYADINYKFIQKIDQYYSKSLLQNSNYAK